MTAFLKHTFSLIGVLTACCTAVAAVRPQPTYTPVEIFNFGQYTTDDGLESNSITPIFKSEDGLMWIGTDDGINTFDGYKFEKLSQSSNLNNSIGRFVSEITQSGKNKMIITTADRGIFEYNTASRKLSAYHLSDSIKNLCDITKAYGVCQVKGSRFFILDNYIIEEDLKTHEQTAIEIPQHALQYGFQLNSVKMYQLLDDEHIVFTMSKSSLLIFNYKYKIIKAVRLPLGFLINSICALEKDRFYMGTSKGVFIYFVNEKRISQSQLLRGHDIHSIIRSNDGCFFIAYDNTKVAKFDLEKLTIDDYKTKYDVLNEQTTVNFMTEDQNNILWLATNNVGLIKIDTKKAKINTSEFVTDNPFIYNTLDIHALNKRNIWTACGIRGIMHIDGETNKTYSIPFPNIYVSAVHARPDGDIFVGTTRGMKLYNTNTQKVTDFVFPVENEPNKRIVVYDICEDCLGNIWVSTLQGLFKYNGIKLERVEVPSGHKALRAIYEDAEGRIWITSESEVMVKEPNSDEFVQIAECEQLQNTFVQYNCFCDNGNEIAIGTSTGLVLYNKERKTVQLSEFNNELSNTAIFSIVRDNNGNLWLFTNKGIGCIDTNYKKVYIFNHFDGLKLMGNECRRFAFTDDIVYFSNTTQISSIDTKTIRFNNLPPETFVDDIEYGQSDQNTKISMINDSCYQTKFLVKASLSIKLASSDFSIPSRNEFLYKVNDEEWHILRNSNEIVLSGLMPGTYEIQFRSTNSDKIWSSNVKKIYVRIAPPMWLSMPAIVFYCIMILSVVWMLLNLRYHSLRKHMKQMEKEARAKKIVESQRNRLAKIHRDQTDSINYAKRIQELIMAKETSVQKYFNKLFVFYKPKNIVSGDFYSFYHFDDKTFIIVSDCTGHGVPGAFLSILGIDHLFNIIMHQRIDDAGTILTMLHKELHETVFKDDKQTGDFNDGMDITICVIHHKERKICFAGAMNDLYRIRDNEITTYRGDRHPIGTNAFVGALRTDAGDDETYKSQIIECQPGDIFYMFTDGYLDQFGGPELKKFKHRRFKYLLMNIHKMPANDQRILLNQKYEEWRGDNEQTDDISVIGFEPWA